MYKSTHNGTTNVSSTESHVAIADVAVNLINTTLNIGRESI
jgi:hypothetical protein